MQKYRFLKNEKIDTEDLKKLIALTKEESLQWSHSDNASALNAYPTSRQAKDNPEVSAQIIGENLKGIRIGYNPKTKLWHYLRLTDHKGINYYVEKNASEELKSLVNQLYAHTILQAAHAN